MGTLRTHPWDFHWDQSHTSGVTGDGAEGDPSPFPTPRTMRPLQGGAEPGYIPGQQGGQTDRQTGCQLHLAAPCTHSKMGPKTGRESRHPGTVTPPCPPNLTTRSLSSAAVSRSPVALKSSTRTSEPLQGERADGPYPQGTFSTTTTPPQCAPPLRPLLTHGACPG